MKTADRKELSLQVYALHKLGISPLAAANMVTKGYIAKKKRLEKAEILAAAAAAAAKVKRPSITYLLKKSGLPSIDKTKVVPKSDKLNQLLAAAKADPSKLSQETLDKVNNHLVGKGEEPIVKAQPFGQSALSVAMNQKYNSLTGHQAAAARIGLDPNTPGLDSMDFNQMKQMLHEQSLAIANAGRAKLGLPPVSVEPEPQQSASYLNLI